MLDTNQKMIIINPEDLFDDKFMKVTDEASFLKFKVNPNDLWPPRLYVEGMLKWGIDASIWAGPFENDTCYVSIIDYSATTTLQTVEQLQLAAQMNNKYSIYSFPYSVWEKFPEMFPLAPELATVGVGFIETYKDGSKACRTQLTQAELNIVKQYCTEAELNSYMIEIICGPQDFKVKRPTIQKPVCLYISGNDDYSFSVFYTTILQAVNALISLKVKSDRHVLEAMNAIFTN